MPALRISTGNPVVSLSGEVDMATAEAAVAALEPWVGAGGPVVLDLSEVTFLDSSGIHVLVQAAKALGKRGCIIIHGAHGSVRTVFQITKLEGAIENLHLNNCEVLARAS